MRGIATSVLTTACMAISASAAEALTIDDYCDPVGSRPAAVREMTPLSDGVSYACISDSEEAIEVYSYKTGKMTGKLFDLNEVKGDVKIDGFDGYLLSDDGRKILLWTDSEKIYRYSFTAEYYVYDVARMTMKRVSEGGAQRCATLSHDGRMVAYMRDNNLFISNLEYGTDVQITKDGAVNKVIYGAPDWGYEEEFGINNTIRWSPDDSLLAFIRFDETLVPAYSFDIYKSYCEEDPLSDIYPEAYTYKYPLAGSPNSIVSVMTCDVSSRQLKTMDLPIGEKDYVPSLEFGGASSSQLMAMVLNRDQNHLTLYSVDGRSTVARRVLEQKSDAWLSPSSYQMVKYGAKSFVIGSEETGYNHLYEYDYSGRRMRALTSGDFNVTAFYGIDGRSGTAYVQTTSLGAVNRNVASVSRSGKLNILHPQEGWESASFSTGFDYYLRSYSSVAVPTQYTIWSAGGKKLADVELNKAYAAKYASAPKVKLVKVPNGAGQEMNGYIITPADFDPAKKYPLLMQQYNGPGSQEVANRWKMDGAFYIASQGYVVAAVDGRGTGFRDRKWSDAVYKQLGICETADQLAGAAWMASQPYIDAERTACFGWSYGGYMTLMELSDPACRFKCGVAMAPVTDWRFYDSIYTERFMLTPQQNKEGYDKSSALLRTENMNLPLLIMSGTSDDNVHIYNTLKYTSKLNYEGKVFDMMALAGFEHSLRMCNARARLYTKILTYLDSHLK